MTVLEIKNYVGSLVDDLSFSYFTTSELTRYINQEIRETAKVLNQAGNNWYLKKDESGSTVANQQEYTPPSDCMAILRLEWVLNPGINETSVGLTSITLNQKDVFAVYADPVAYFWRGPKIALVPIPQSVRTLRYWYLYRVPEISSDSDTPDIPTEYHEYLAMRVAKKCLIKDGRDASLLLEDLRKVEDDLKAEAQQRSQDRSRQVVCTDDGSFGTIY